MYFFLSRIRTFFLGELGELRDFLYNYFIFILLKLLIYKEIVVRLLVLFTVPFEFSFDKSKGNCYLLLTYSLLYCIIVLEMELVI